MTESELQELITGEAPKFDAFLMRNNNGAITYKDSTGHTRHVRFGLGNISESMSKRIKSSDLIGGISVTITPDMVGTTVLIFTAVEVKDPHWHMVPSDKRAWAQNNFIEFIKSKGGRAGFATSLDDFRKIITE